MNCEAKWTLKDVNKKIENLEMRLVKAKRLGTANTKSNENIHNKKNMNVSKTSIGSGSPPQKHHQTYLKLARKFITFSNSI